MTDKPKQFLHIVWSPTTGPLYAYWRPDIAHDHARTMVGVDVGSAEIRSTPPSSTAQDLRAVIARTVTDAQVSEVEALDQLPAFVRDDILSDDYATAEMTPVDLEDLEDDEP